jgi:hypothetical protein
VEPVIVLVAVLGGAVIGLARWHWSDAARIRRALRGARPVSIAEAPEDELVRLDGRIMEGETVEAPLSGRRCVYYIAIVEKKHGNDSWRERARETGGVGFTIDDGTGCAIVDPTGARIDVAFDRTTYSGGLDRPGVKERAFLERHGLEAAGWIFNKELRYREGVFEVGEPIAIMCQPVREPDPAVSSREAGYRDAPPTRLRIGGSSRYPILLSDSRRVTQRQNRNGTRARRSRG